MLRVKSTSSVLSSRQLESRKRVSELLEAQRYKIECYKAWIKALAPKDSHAIFQEIEERLAERE